MRHPAEGPVPETAPRGGRRSHPSDARQGREGREEEGRRRVLRKDAVCRLHSEKGEGRERGAGEDAQRLRAGAVSAAADGRPSHEGARGGRIEETGTRISGTLKLKNFVYIASELT